MEAVAQRRPGELREVRVRGPSAPSVPPFSGPAIVYEHGEHLLELVVGDEGTSQLVSDGLIIRSEGAALGVPLPMPRGSVPWPSFRHPGSAISARWASAR
jgi:hypothetical protein